MPETNAAAPLPNVITFSSGGTFGLSDTYSVANCGYLRRTVELETR